MKLKRLSDIYIIYNKETGDLYCAAESIEVAEQIIKDDSKAGWIEYPEDMTITDLHNWGEDKE